MTVIRMPVMLVCVCLVFASSAIGGSIPKPNYDRPIPDFALKDVDGKAHHLSDYSDRKAVAVVFFGLGCPLSNLYNPRFQSIADKFALEPVAFLAINSNDQDSLEDMKASKKEFNFRVPLLRDEDSAVADAFGAYRTNEVYLLDGDRRIVYHGAIDDQYGIGYQRATPEHTYLIDAIEQTLAGKNVAVPRTQGIGCVIGRAAKRSTDTKITYHDQIERVFQNNCVACHREGQIAPFELTSYEETKGWAGMIREVVEQRRMPPWYANPKHGRWLNDRSLTEDEIDMILKWVDAGTPEGDPADAPLPVDFPIGWVMGEPDMIVEMDEEFEVPAEGVIQYQYYQVKLNLDEPKWVIAGEIQPGEPSVVHHVLTFLTPQMSDEQWAHFKAEQQDEMEEFGKRHSEKARKKGDRKPGRSRKQKGERRERRVETKDQTKKRDDGQASKQPGGFFGQIANAAKGVARGLAFADQFDFDRNINYFIGNVPGQMPTIFPEGTAKYVPKKCSIVFQVHYTANGRKVTDRTKLGLRFAKQMPKYRVRTSSAYRADFVIPPNASNHHVTAEAVTGRNMKLISFIPHMHLRGKSFRYELRTPDDKQSVLLDVPRYDFGWQIRYVLDKPMFVPLGSKILCTAVFDNSSQNPANPDPDREVRWGDQTFAEMMIGFYDYIDLKPLR